MAEFEKVSILDQVEYWWTVKRMFLKDIHTIQPSMRTWFYDKCYNKENKKHIYANVANCAIEHYTIIKQAYKRGFERILIMEDDIVFRIDANQFDIVMSNIPQDFDLITYRNGFRNVYHPNSFKVINDENLRQYIHITQNSKNWMQNGTLMYAVNRNMMKFIIDYYDTNGIIYADKFFNEVDRNTYKVYEPACEITYHDNSNTTIDIDRFD